MLLIAERARPWVSISQLPTTTERSVKLDQGQQLITAGHGQTAFGLKEFAVGIERVEQGRYATAVTQVGQTGTISQRVNKQFALLAHLSCLAKCDQRIGDVAKRPLHRLLVIDQQEIALGLR